MNPGRRGLLAAALVAAPVLAGAGYAALGALGLTGPGAAGYSPVRVSRVLAEAAVWRGLAWSAWVALASTALAAAGAVLVAALFRGSGRLDRTARVLALLPLPVPHLVAAVGALLFLSQSGYLARVLMALGLVQGPAGVPPLVYDTAGAGLILALAWKELPFLALVAMAVLATRGVELEETARGLGASSWQAFRLVTWPLLWRGLLPAMVAVFVFVLGTYEATALLAPSDPLALPLLTLERYTDADLARRGDGFVMVLVGLGAAAAAVAAHEWVRARGEGLLG